MLPNLHEFRCNFSYFLFLNFFFPDGAILKYLLLSLYTKRYLQTELEFNPETFGILDNIDVLVIFIFTVRVFVRLF